MLTFRATVTGGIISYVFDYAKYYGFHNITRNNL